MSPWLIEFDSRCFNYSSPLKRETQPHSLLPTSSTSSSTTTSSVSEPVCGSTEPVVLFWPDAIVSIPRNRWSLLTLRLLFLRSPPSGLQTEASREGNIKQRVQQEMPVYGFFSGENCFSLVWYALRQDIVYVIWKPMLYFCLVHSVWIQCPAL